MAELLLFCSPSQIQKNSTQETAMVSAREGEKGPKILHENENTYNIIRCAKATLHIFKFSSYIGVLREVLNLSGNP